MDDIKAATGHQVDFPLFCDPDREKSVELGVLDESNKDAKGLPMTVRSVFILKPDKTIALIMTYPATCGRNFDEILRCVDSLQLTAGESVATPVNWKKGDDVIVNFPLTDADADEKFGKVNEFVFILFFLVLILLLPRVWIMNERKNIFDTDPNLNCMFLLTHEHRVDTELLTFHLKRARNCRNITSGTRETLLCKPRRAASSPCSQRKINESCTGIESID